MVPASDASALWGASLTGRRGCFECLRFFFCGPPELAGISLGGVPSGRRGPSPDAGAAVALRGSGGGCRGDMARAAFRLCARGCRRSLSSSAAASDRRTMGARDRTCDRACDRDLDARRLMMRATGALALGDGELETGLTGVSHGILGLGH